MNKNKIFSAIKRGEINGINTLFHGRGLSVGQQGLKNAGSALKLSAPPVNKRLAAYFPCRQAFFHGLPWLVTLEWTIMNESLNLNQPVNAMGPNELEAYAALETDSMMRRTRSWNAVGVAMTVCCHMTNSCRS